MLTSSAPATSFRVVLSNRHFLRIWVARGCGQIGVTAVNFALIVLVQTVTHSSTAISGLILAFYVPAVLFAGLAGVLADRLRKRSIMVVTTGLRAVVLASLIVVSRDWPWPLLLGFLYLATFLFSLLSQFNGPAEGALLPRLVGRRLLIPANALLTIGFSVAQFLGFTVLGPILAAVTGWRGLVVAATLLYLVSTVLIAGLPGDKPTRPMPVRRPPAWWPASGRTCARASA